jgi:hypothetical protein
VPKSLPRPWTHPLEAPGVVRSIVLPWLQAADSFIVFLWDLKHISPKSTALRTKKYTLICVTSNNYLELISQRFVLANSSSNFASGASEFSAPRVPPTGRSTFDQPPGANVQLSMSSFIHIPRSRSPAHTQLVIEIDRRWNPPVPHSSSESEWVTYCRPSTYSV